MKMGAPFGKVILHKGAHSPFLNGSYDMDNFDKTKKHRPAMI